MITKFLYLLGFGFYSIWTDIKAMLRSYPHVLRHYHYYFWGIPLLLAIIVFLLAPYDKHLVFLFNGPWRIRSLWLLAGRISHYGDFQTGTLFVVIVIWLFGLAKRRQEWKRAALATLLAASLAGTAATSCRAVIARPRPNATITTTRFYYKGQSFPSAHSATAFATAACLCLTFPHFKTIFVLAACSVAFSRLYTGAHYPTDIIAGSFFGLWFGILIGLAYRQLMTPTPPQKA